MAHTRRSFLTVLLFLAIFCYAVLVVYHTSIAEDAQAYDSINGGSDVLINRYGDNQQEESETKLQVLVEEQKHRPSREEVAQSESEEATEPVPEDTEAPSPPKNSNALVLLEDDRFPDPITEILPPFRMAPVTISVFTYRDWRVTYQQLRFEANRCSKPRVSLIPAGNYTVRYVGGAWKDSGMTEESQWSVTFSIEIDNRTVFSLPAKSWHATDEDARASVTPGTAGFLDLRTAETVQFRTQNDWATNKQSCEDDQGEIQIMLYAFEKGCIPSPGVYRSGTDLETVQWKDVPGVVGNRRDDWESCCKLCDVTDKCQTWESNPGRGCMLKHGTAEEQVSMTENVVSGKRPSTGISHDSGLHRPTKLFVASHPDDDAIFFGEHLKDGYHKDSFNDWYVVTTTLEYVSERKFEERQSMMVVNANYEMWGWDDIFCAKENPCNPILNIGLIYDLIDLLTMRPWTDIVTHNHLGEYGNPFHVGMNRVIMNLTQELVPDAQVWVFDPRPDDPDVTHLVWNMTEAIKEHLERLLSETKRDLLRAYQQRVNRVIHYQFWMENVVKVEDYNYTHSKHVCEHYGEGIGNICCEDHCVHEYEWMLERALSDTPKRTRKRTRARTRGGGGKKDDEGHRGRR